MFSDNLSPFTPTLIKCQYEIFIAVFCPVSNLSRHFWAWLFSFFSFKEDDFHENTAVESLELTPGFGATFF